MSAIAFLREMLARGLPLEQAMIAAEAYEANPQKSAAAIRQKRYRDNKRNGSSRVTTNVTQTSPDKEIPPTPPKEINPTPSSPPKGGSVSPAAPRSELDKLQDQLLEAAGIVGFREERSPGLVNLAPIRGLLEQGYLLEIDILPVIRDISRRGKRPSSWAYFVNPIIEAATTKRGIPPKPPDKSEDWAGRLAVFRQSGTWGAWGPKPGESGCRVPPELMREVAA